MATGSYLYLNIKYYALLRRKSHFAVINEKLGPFFSCEWGLNVQEHQEP